MANKKTTVILTSYQIDKTKPTKIKLCQWTEPQKQEFINYVQGHIPAEGSVIDGRAFNVHYDTLLIHCRPSETSRKYTPRNSRNKSNELIIEVITDEENRECWPMCPAVCPLCINDGQCTSPFIQKYIGEILFPEKYKKQR